MNYFDTKKNQVLTEMMVKMRGLPFNEDVLKEIGIFPITYNYPEYDRDIEYIIPTSDLPILKDNNYVIAFEINNIDEEQLANTVTRLADEKGNEARKFADQTLEPLLSKYSESEKLTFFLQNNEVNAYIKDPAAETPTIDGLALARGISRDDLLQKAMVKIAMFTQASQTVIGTQQKYEDTIKSIVESEKTNKEKILELKALKFEYTLPDLEKIAKAALKS